jgi:hypothetical protein
MVMAGVCLELQGHQRFLSHGRFAVDPGESLLVAPGADNAVRVYSLKTGGPPLQAAPISEDARSSHVMCPTWEAAAGWRGAGVMGGPLWCGSRNGDVWELQMGRKGDDVGDG